MKIRRLTESKNTLPSMTGVVASAFLDKKYVNVLFEKRPSMIRFQLEDLTTTKSVEDVIDGILKHGVTLRDSIPLIEFSPTNRHGANEGRDTDRHHIFTYFDDVFLYLPKAPHNRLEALLKAPSMAFIKDVCFKGTCFEKLNDEAEEFLSFVDRQYDRKLSVRKDDLSDNWKGLLLQARNTDVLNGIFRYKMAAVIDEYHDLTDLFEGILTISLLTAMKATGLDVSFYDGAYLKYIS